MLNVRMEALQEHNDRLGALITDLQIKRANQVVYNMQLIKSQQFLECAVHTCLSCFLFSVVLFLCRLQKSTSNSVL